MSENHHQTDTETTSQEGRFEAFMAHQRRACVALGEAIEAALPPAFVEHGERAINESMQGFRVLLDALRERVSFSEQNDEEPPNSNKVRVEVN